MLAGLAFTIVAACFGGCSDDNGTSTSGGSRPVTMFNGVPFGATCNDDGDCGGQKDSCCTGGKCSPEGWCSPTCASDQDCPEGFFCIDRDGKRCFSICSDDRDCPTNFICEDKDQHLTCRYK
jgi:hypothetical protein